MKLLSVQIALFLNGLTVRADIFAENINKKLNDMFDAMPVCLDLPVEAPIDMPIVHRKGTNTLHTLTVARSRCDLCLILNSNDDELKQFKEKYNHVIVEFVNAVLEQCTVNRVGIVYNGFERLEMPCKYIVEKYFNSRVKIGDEISFRINNIQEVKNIKINNVFNVSNFIKVDEDEKESGVLVTRDINSVTENNVLVEINDKDIINILKYSYTFLTNEKFGEIKNDRYK